MKTLTITSKNINKKQWSNLILELNLVKNRGIADNAIVKFRDQV